LTDLLIKGASELVFFADYSAREPSVIVNGSLAISDGRIEAVGTTEEVLGAINPPQETLDAVGHLVTPGLVDSHAHLVFAGSREDEFVRRMSGESYQSIAASGGGILSTVRETRRASAEELLELGKSRLATMLANGTTTVEAKSGYGLEVESELKCLRVARKLDQCQPVRIVNTFLGAHALPPEYENDRAGYIELIAREMLPRVVKEKLAEFCDVFCDVGAFSVEEMAEILGRAKELGLLLKAHLDEFENIGGVEVACRLGATSVDHLTKSGAKEARACAKSRTVATFMPATTLHLGEREFADARSFIDAGAEVAIASDFNPGSAYCESLAASIILAGVYLKMKPKEIIRAMTVGGAKALGRNDGLGIFRKGSPADVVVWKAPSLNYLVYHWGVNLVERVVAGGKMAF
jgi:imidazolonepropionase